jgi:hypothetical protein
MYFYNERWNLCFSTEAAYRLFSLSKYKKKGLRPLSAYHSSKDRVLDFLKEKEEAEILLKEEAFTSPADQYEASLRKQYEYLFWNMWKQLGYSLPKDTQFSFMFGTKV